MYAVILAGGSGTRFWPLSRKKSPKQLMSVFGGKSMLQRTVERILPLKPQRILVVTNALQAEESARQLREYRASAGSTSSRSRWAGTLLRLSGLPR